MARISLDKKLEALSARLTDEVKAYRELERRLVSELEAKRKAIAALRAEFNEAMDTLTGRDESNGDFAEVNPDVDPDEGQSKNDRVLSLYEKNPRTPSKQAILTIEGSDDEAAAKRFYATRYYLKKNGRLREEDDGSWTVIRPRK